MNFQASWWGHSQRWTDGRGGAAGHFQEWHLSLGTNSRKFSFWKAGSKFYIRRTEKWQISTAAAIEEPHSSKMAGNTWVELGITQKPTKIKGNLCRSPGGFCLKAEMPHKRRRDDWMLETLKRGWEQLLFSFTQDVSFSLFVERFCKQRILKDSLQYTWAFNAFEVLMEEAEAGSPWMTHNESKLGQVQVAPAPNWVL